MAGHHCTPFFLRRLHTRRNPMPASNTRHLPHPPRLPRTAATRHCIGPAVPARAPGQTSQPTLRAKRPSPTVTKSPTERNSNHKNSAAEWPGTTPRQLHPFPTSKLSTLAAAVLCLAPRRRNRSAAGPILPDEGAGLWNRYAIIFLNFAGRMGPAATRHVTNLANCAAISTLLLTTCLAASAAETPDAQGPPRRPLMCRYAAHEITHAIDPADTCETCRAPLASLGEAPRFARVEIILAPRFAREEIRPAPRSPLVALQLRARLRAARLQRLRARLERSEARSEALRARLFHAEGQN